jgi:two-component system, chemotaxis family, sensor kinase CheA
MDQPLDYTEIVQIFSAESEENLRDMEMGFVQLESTPDDGETLQAIFRAAHTIKGNAAGLGFSSLAKFAHAVEDVLDGLRTGASVLTTPLATALLEAVDTLRALIVSAVAGSDELRPPHLDLIESLRLEAGLALVGAAGSVRQAGGERRRDDRRKSAGRRLGDVHGARVRTLRVSIEKLDRILNLTGEIAVMRERLADLLDGADRRVPREEVLEAHRASDRLFMDLQEEVMKIRMVPLGPTFRQFVRTVRDVATTQGKEAYLEVAGEDVEVDTNVIEHLRDPLTHIIRNAIDHGIETPEERRAGGKESRGRILLAARHDGGAIVISIQDDGAGLDRARVVERARAMGYGADVDRLSDGELFRLILEPGFSTATEVTEYSGRGVGMDVVRRNVEEQLRGVISIESRAGAGTTFMLRLPLTLAIIHGFAVGVEGETYVMPLDSVIECIELPRDTKGAGSRGVMNLRGQPVPYLRLRDCFRLGGERPDRENVLVLRHHDQSVGLVVDRLLGENQTVIKPLSRALGDVPGVAGSAILGNGRVALILEVEGLLREALRGVESAPRTSPGWNWNGTVS